LLSGYQIVTVRVEDGESDPVSVGRGVITDALYLLYCLMSMQRQ